MLRAPPIPPALWERLARLDARCDLELFRTSTGPTTLRHTSGRNYSRMWRVRVIERAPGGRTLICEAPTFFMAVEGAVEEAEDYGLHRPVTSDCGRSG